MTFAALFKLKNVLKIRTHGYSEIYIISNLILLFKSFIVTLYVIGNQGVNIYRKYFRSNRI